MKRSGVFSMLILLAFPYIMIAGFLDGDVIPTATRTCEDPTLIHLPCGIEIDTRNPETALPPELVLRAPQEGIGTWLVQFDGPIYEHERTALEATGALIDGYLPNYTYIARMDQSTKDRAAKLDGVTWVGDYHPGYKISPEIDLVSRPPQEFVILLYSWTDGESIRDAVEAAGGQMLSWQPTSAETVVRVIIESSQIPELVKLPQIKWVEPAPQYQWFNADAQWVVQTWVQDNRRIWDKGLTGEGQVVNSTDTGLRTTHNFYRDPDISITTWGDYPDHRKVIAYQPADPAMSQFGDEIGHGTGTAGCLAGNDRSVGGESPNIGMAPDAKLYFLDAGGPGGMLTVGDDIEVTLAKAYDGNSAGGARISSNSWGNPFITEYDASCAQADRLMWNRPDYLVFVSAGNMPMATHTVNPADAKNVVCVGGSLNGTSADAPWPLSTPGPAGDGRIKPEIVVPATVTTATFESDDAEVPREGTSAACPVAAGNATLIRQYFTDGYYPSGAPEASQKFNPSAALLKAMLINSVEIDFAGKNVPDATIGWGRPKLDNVLYFPADERKLCITDYDEGLATGQQFETAIKVTDDGEGFRVSLVWTDYPGVAGADPALVNDLNLEVASPSAKTYRGNNFANNESVEGGSFDALNPVENVFLNSSETGIWTIRVRANNVPQGPQPFALVLTGGGLESIGIDETPTSTCPMDLRVAADRTVGFFLRAPADIRLEVWDVAGRRVQTLLEGQLDAGTHSVDWDTKTLPSGSYFITLRTKDKTLSAKAVVIR